jgi:DeoR family fructose operon transcriptional repressor
MMSHADEVIVLADSTKFGRRLFAQVAELGRADRLVSDAAPDADLYDALQAADVRILTPQNAPPESSP